MDRAVKPGEKWTTFIFDDIDCAEFGVYAITSGSTYSTNLASNFNDNLQTVSAYDGQYYYGTQITGQQFNFNMFAENLTYDELSRLKGWLSPRHIGKLILSTQPFKYYYVKPVSIGELGAIPLSSVQTPIYTTSGIITEGETVFTGEFTITFQTVGSAFAYGLSYLRDDLIYNAKDYGYPDNYYYDSGLLYKEEMPKLVWDIPANADRYPIPIYNPGDVPVFPRFKAHTNGLSLGDSPVLTFINKTTGDVAYVDLKGITGDVIIDFTDQIVTSITNQGGQDVQMTYYGRIKGNPMKISERGGMMKIDAFDPEEDTDKQLFTIENNVVTLTTDKFPTKSYWTDKYYFCTNDNGGALITGVTDNTITLSSSPNSTSDIPEDGFEFNYKENNSYTAAQLKNNEPAGVDGDVMKAIDTDDWFAYRGHWGKTSLFNSIRQFQDDEGNLIPVKVFMTATVVELDDLVISTNIPAMKLEVEVLPRYV